MMSCFTPFISEFMYLNLRNGLPEGHVYRQDSIHFLQIPQPDQSLIDQGEDNVVTSVDNMKQVVEIARLIRDQNNIPVKKPILKMKIINSNPHFLAGLQKFENYLKEEVNCIEIEVEPNEEAFVYYKVDWDKKALGKRLQKAFKAIEPQLSTLSSNKIREYILNGTITIDGVEILPGELKPSRHFHAEYEEHKVWKNKAVGEFAVMLDTTMTKEIEYGYYSREFLNKIQKMRKDNNLEIDADIEIFYEADTKELGEAIEMNHEGMKDKLKKRFINAKHLPHCYPRIAQSDFKIHGQSGKIYICNVGISFDRQRVLEKLAEKGGEKF